MLRIRVYLTRPQLSSSITEHSDNYGDSRLASALDSHVVSRLGSRRNCRFGCASRAVGAIRRAAREQRRDLCGGPALGWRLGFAWPTTFADTDLVVRTSRCTTRQLERFSLLVSSLLSPGS